jgi:hypothetical protein
VLSSFIIVLISLRILWQPSHQRQKLIDAIGKQDVLRFVGGYPLPPDLNSNAPSVQQTIHALGENVALASFRIDKLRALFESDEGMDVLGPIDDALNRKRKASEIDNDTEPLCGGIKLARVSRMPT